MLYQSKSVQLFSSAILALFILVATPVRAEIEIYNEDGKRLSFLFDGAFGLFKTYGTNFGAGITTPNGQTRNNVQWLEGFAIPYIEGSIDTDLGEAYGSVGIIAAATRGTSDAGALTFGQPGKIDVEYAYLGWKSGDLLPKKDLFDLSFGRQNFVVGDGFLINDGNLESDVDGGLYLGGRFSFRQTAIARINTEPVRFEFFQLKADNDFGSPKLVGGNIEWHNDDLGVLGAYGFVITQARPESSLKDMTAIAFRGRGTPLALLDDDATSWLGGWELAFEYVHQNNDKLERKMDADGWYLEAGYHAENALFTPHIFYRYLRFSGDDADPDVDRGFNRLFTAGDNYGSWFLGEITGQYVQSSNLRVHQIGGRWYPEIFNIAETGVLFYNFSYDRLAAGGVEPVTSHDFGKEFNVYLKYEPAEWLTLAPVAGVLIPGRGAKQFYGHDENYYILQLAAFISF